MNQKNLDVPIETILKCCIRDLKKAYQIQGELHSEIDELKYLLKEEQNKIQILSKKLEHQKELYKETKQDLKQSPSYLALKQKYLEVKNEKLLLIKDNSNLRCKLHDLIIAH